MLGDRATNVPEILRARFIHNSLQDCGLSGIVYGVLLRCLNPFLFGALLTSRSPSVAPSSPLG